MTADADFLRLAETRVPPPRVIWLENCNYKTAVVEELLRRNAIRIADLEQSDRPILISETRLEGDAIGRRRPLLGREDVRTRLRC